MTSQLNVDTIVDKAGSGGSNVKMANTSTYVSDGGNVTQNLVQSLCKVWYVGDMSGGAALSATDSFGTSSFTDVTTGIHKPNFTNNFRANKAYGFAGAHGHNSDVTDLVYSQQCHNDNDFGTGSCEIVSSFAGASTQGVFDYAYVTNQFVGDLA